MSALWMILTAVFLIVFVGSLIGLTMPESRGTAGAVAAASAVLYVVMSFFFIYDKVEAGHAGLVKQFGAYQDGTKDAGAVFHWPWQSVEEVRIRNASHEIRMDNPGGGPNGGAASQESQEVFVVATLNYSLEKACVRDLYTNYGSSYYDTVIEPRVKQIFKAETVKFEAIKILPNRELIRRETQAELTKQLKQYCVRGLDFLLKNIGFGKAFTAAIEEKQVATQLAAAEENRVKIAENKADQVAAAADGQARATVRLAKADAVANRLRGRNLTPNLVEWERIQKWQPEVIYLPADAIPVIQPRQR